MFRRSMAAVAAVAVVSFAAPASAAILVIEAIGTFSGTDTNDVLGLGGGQLSDVAFTLNFAFDVGNAVRFLDGENDTAAGGADYAAPLLSAMYLTLGDRSFTHYGDQQDLAIQGPLVVQQWTHESTGHWIYIGAAYDVPTIVGDLTAPPSGNLCLTATCYGFVNFGASLGLGGALTPTSYTVSYDADASLPPLPGAIPEPSTWALMIAGFGLAGAALRRRAVAGAATTA